MENLYRSIGNLKNRIKFILNKLLVRFRISRIRDINRRHNNILYEDILITSNKLLKNSNNTQKQLDNTPVYKRIQLIENKTISNTISKRISKGLGMFLPLKEQLRNRNKSNRIIWNISKLRLTKPLKNSKKVLKYLFILKKGNAKRRKFPNQPTHTNSTRTSLMSVQLQIIIYQKINRYEFNLFLLLNSNVSKTKNKKLLICSKKIRLWCQLNKKKYHNNPNFLGKRASPIFQGKIRKIRLILQLRVKHQSIKSNYIINSINSMFYWINKLNRFRIRQ